jgi:hypothetical protein
MAALKDILAEQSRIKDELKRMETDDDTYEDQDGNIRDTLIERWKELDEQAKPVISRMEQIKAITRTAQDEANLERPGGSDGTSASRFGSPELVISGNRDPYDCQDAIRNERQVLMTRTELKSRALDAVESEVKRGNLAHDFAEEATLKAQSNAGIARHMLLYGSQEYQEAFRAYCEDPEHLPEVHRAALTLSSGSVMLPFVLDQLVA